MIAVLVAGGGLTVIGVARAAFRARARLQTLPPSLFGVVDTRGGAQSPFVKGGFRAAMDVREARDILGLPLQFSRSQLNDAHRRALLSNHPDRGGSTFLAQKINEAKKLLTKGSSST